MRHYFKIIGYNKPLSCYNLLDSDNHCHLVEFPLQSTPVFPEDLIGSTISVSYLEPVIEKAHDIRIEKTSPKVI